MTKNTVSGNFAYEKLKDGDALISQKVCNEQAAAAIRTDDAKNIRPRIDKLEEAFKTILKEISSGKKRGETFLSPRKHDDYIYELVENKDSGNMILSVSGDKSFVAAIGDSFADLKKAGETALNTVMTNTNFHSKEIEKANNEKHKGFSAFTMNEEKIKGEGKGAKKFYDYSHSISVIIWGAPDGLVHGGNSAEVIVDFVGRTNNGSFLSGTLSCQREEAENKVRHLVESIDLTFEKQDESAAKTDLYDLENEFRNSGCMTITINGGDTWSVEDVSEIDADMETSKVVTPDFDKMPSYFEGRAYVYQNEADLEDDGERLFEYY